MVQLNFDARAVKPASVDGGAEQLPVSDGMGYMVVIVSDEVVCAKSNPEKNQFLALRLRVVEGPHTGAYGLYRLNLVNENSQAVEIARGQLSALCHAIGAFHVGDTSELHNKPFRVVVVPQDDPKYTQIKGVLTAQGIDPGNPNAGPRSATMGATAAAAPAAQTFAAPAAQTFAAPAPQPAFGQQPQAQPAPAQAWTPPAATATPPAATATPPAAPWGAPKA